MIPRNQRWLLNIVMLGAWAVRLLELSLQDIWWDEARNIDVSLRPLGSVSIAPELDIHPPTYFWLLHAWGRLAGLSSAMEPVQIAYLSRFLSVAAGLVGVALLYVLTRSIASNSGLLRGSGVAVLAAAIGASSPFWLAESQEARMYTLGFVWMMSAAYVFLRAILQTAETRSPKSRFNRFARLVMFAVLSALALSTHYNAVFILLAWYAWWWGYVLLGEKGERLRSLVTVAGTGALTVLLVSPVIPIALRQIPGYENPNLTVPSIGQYLWQNWQAYLWGYAYSAESMYGLGVYWLALIGAIFLGGMILYLVVSYTTFRVMVRSRISFALFWLAGGLALYYVAVVDRGAFNVRYSSFVTPALYTTLAIAVWAWRRVHNSLPTVGAIVLFVGFAAGIRADVYDETNAREDISGVTTWLRANAGPDDVIFTDQKYPFGFYYDRYAIEVDQETEANPATAEEAPARYLFVDINEIDQRMNEWASQADKVFWVQWYESDTDPRRAVSFLLDKEGERLGEEWFRGYSIDWWQLHPPTRFELAPHMQPMRLQFESAVATSEVSLPTEASQKVPVVIRWERVAGGKIDRPLKARVAAYDENDNRLAQVDKRILNDRHLLPSEWKDDDKPLNVYLLEIPDASPGEYSVRLLVYDADSLEPLSFLDAAGNPAGVEPVLGTVQIVENR